VGTWCGQALLQGQPAAVEKAAVIPKELSSYRLIVKKVLPAVVSIDSQGKGGRNRPDDEEDSSPSRIGFGSGFLISPKGVIVTNNHVVAGADHVLVQLRDGRKFTSKKIKTDPKTDLAIIQLDSKLPLPFLQFGDSSEMEIGDRVLAVGAPFGLTGTVTHGIISSTGRSLGVSKYEDFLQTDAAINPGNSGGPLISLDGKVIGITSAIKSRTGGFQGIGLAISSNLGKSIVEQLLKNGVVRRGYLGIGIGDVDEERAKELGLKEAVGVMVTRIIADSPGEKAGLKRGDVIVGLGGKGIKDRRELLLTVAAQPLDKPVELKIVRDGKEKALKVTILEEPNGYGSQPVPVPEPGKGAIVVEKAGVTVADLTSELAEALGYPEKLKGVLITRIDRTGLAAQAGLRPGMVILRVNKKPVATAEAFSDAVKVGSTSKGITVQARGPRGGTRSYVLKEEE
jgi:serine protease Do